MRIRVESEGNGSMTRVTNLETGESVDGVVSIVLDKIERDRDLTGVMEVYVEKIDVVAEVGVVGLCRCCGRPRP